MPPNMLPPLPNKDDVAATMDATIEQLLIEPEFIECCSLLQYFNTILNEQLQVLSMRNLAEWILAEEFHPHLQQLLRNLRGSRKTALKYSTVLPLTAFTDHPEAFGLSDAQCAQLNEAADHDCSPIAALTGNIAVPLKLRLLNVLLVEYTLGGQAALSGCLSFDKLGRFVAASHRRPRLGRDQRGRRFWCTIDAVQNVFVYERRKAAAASGSRWRLCAAGLPALGALIAQIGEQVEEEDWALVRTTDDAADDDNAVVDNKELRKIWKTIFQPKKYTRLSGNEATGAETFEEIGVLRPLAEVRKQHRKSCACGCGTPTKEAVICGGCSRGWRQQCVEREAASEDFGEDGDDRLRWPPLLGWVCAACAQLALLARLCEVHRCVVGLPAQSMDERLRSISQVPAHDGDCKFLNTTAPGILDQSRALTGHPKSTVSPNSKRVRYTDENANNVEDDIAIVEPRHLTTRPPLLATALHPLAIHFADPLVWRAHIDAVRREATTRIALLERLNERIGAGQLAHLYTEHVRSALFEHDVHIWAGGCTPADWAHFDALQARAQRAVNKAAAVGHTRRQSGALQFDALQPRRDSLTLAKYDEWLRGTQKAYAKWKRGYSPDEDAEDRRQQVPALIEKHLCEVLGWSAQRQSVSRDERLEAVCKEWRGCFLERASRMRAQQKKGVKGSGV